MDEMARNYVERIQCEADELQRIDQTIKLFEENIMNQKRQVGGVHAVLENQKQMQSQIQILERRLNRTVQKFNSITTQNVSLRSDIESLKQERQEFERLSEKSASQTRVEECRTRKQTEGVLGTDQLCQQRRRPN